jgi:hypothetical protein
LPDEVMITDPPPRAFMAGVTAFRVRQGPMMLTSSTSKNSSSGMSANG